MKKTHAGLWKILLCVSLVILMVSVGAIAVFAAETEGTPINQRGYYLTIYNCDGTVGMNIDGSKSGSEFSIRTAMDDARVFVDNAFLFGIKTPATYVIDMYEDSHERASFEIGSDVTINGQGHSILLDEGVSLTNKGTLNNVTVVEPVQEVATLAELQAALAAEGNTPIVITAQIVIPAGETVTLDLNGKTVNSVFNGASTTNHIYALANRGNLTITDTSADQAGSINSRGIYNYGSLTLEAGAINAIDGNGGYALNNESGSTFVMNGGIIAATYEDDHMSSEGGYDATSVDIPAGCTATLNGGKIFDACDFTYAIASAGTLNIPADSTIVIEGYHGAISISGGTTTINGGTFTVPYDNAARTDNVLYVYGGALIINGGSFIGDSDNYSGGCCLYDAKGTAVINGGTFGGSSGGDVWGTTGTTIKGGTFENLTETSLIAEGYKIENGVIVPDFIPVAKIGDKSFAALEDAIKAANNGDTVTLLSDIESSATISIVGKNITLDLAGHVISGTCNASQASLIYVENGAELTIKDSVGNGKLTFAQGSSNVGWTIDVKGALVLESGTIELTGSWSIGYAVDVRPNAWGTAYTSATTFVMNGGQIISSDGGVRVASSSADNYKNISASFIMNGGLIEADWDGVFVQQSNTIYDALGVTINDGKIASALNPIRVYGPAPTGYVNTQDCINITLAGGSFEYTGTAAQTWVIEGILRAGGGSSVETILESGSIEVSEAVAQTADAPEGYEWAASADGAYQLVAVSYVAKIGDKYFATFKDAIAAVEDGVVINLTANITLTETLTLNKSVTINGNGFALIPATNSAYASAIMAGDSGWGDDHGETIILKNLTISGWNTNYGAVRAQGVTLVMENCVLDNNSVSNDAYGVVSLNYADATITGCKFNNNTSKVIDVNYNADSSESVVTIDGCEFVGNSSTGAGIIYRNAGEKLTIKNSKFINNTVSTNGNAATVYLGWGAGHEIIGCIFDGNNVVTSHATTKRFASAIFADGCKIEGNVFLNNTATRNGEAITTAVAIGAYYGAADISANYWVDGSKPVLGVIYTVEYTRCECTLDSYCTTYELDENGNAVVGGEKGMIAAVAKIGDTEYATLAEAFAALKNGDTLLILAGEYSEGTIQLPAYLTNVTIKGEAGAILKDMTISAADGNSFSYIGLTFDSITFENSGIILTGWRNGEETIEDLTVQNCVFKNVNNTTNNAALHINKDAAEAVKNLTFVNNVIDGLLGGQKSGIYAQVTGNIVMTGNVINNVTFRSFIIQITTNDGVADEFIATGNTFSNSAAGRTQCLASSSTGTDSVNLVVSGNIFKGITASQQICYYNFNAAVTTADLSGNYYDIDILANPAKIYYNSAAAGVEDLTAMGIFPIYTELNADGTINMDSAFTPAPKIVIEYTNLALTENFKLSFAFAKGAVADWTGYSVVIVKTSAADGSETTVTIPVSAWAVTSIGGADYIVVDYAGISASEMTDVLSVAICDANGNVVSEEKTDSIKDYAMRKLARSTDAQLSTLLVDILNYGAEAQVFFGYAADALANADLTDEQKALATPAREYSDEMYSKTYADGYSFNVGNTLTLEYNVQLKVGMDLRAVNVSDDAVINVSYVDYNGQTVSKQVSISEYDYRNEPVYVTCDTLTALDHNAKITFSLVDCGNTILTFTNSVEGFTARLSADNNKAAICTALMQYCDSAEAYFNK